MKKFEVIDHPQHLKIKIFGETLDELFTNSAVAMMTFLYPSHINIIDHEVKNKIVLKADEPEELLASWLLELLTLSKEKDMCCSDFHFDSITKGSLKATVYGKRILKNNRIKKIFTHDLKIKKYNEHYQINIMFEI